MRAELPHIAADILMRLRARGPRVHCITNAVAQTFTANMLLAAGAIPSMTLCAGRDRRVRGARRRAAGQSRHLRRGAARRGRRGARGRGRTAHSLGARSGVHRSLGGRARTMRSRWSRRSRTRCGSTRAEFAALSAAEPEDAALAAYARDTRAVMALTGTVDRIADGAQQIADRERSSADGARHRHGLRGVGADGGVPRGRERCVQGDGLGAVVLRRRGRDRGRARERAGQLSGGAARCALCARQHTLTEKARVT